MSVLSAQTIRALCMRETLVPHPSSKDLGLYIEQSPMLEPFVERSVDTSSGLSYGLSTCGYDIRLKEEMTLWQGDFRLASTVERFRMPSDVVGIVHDKSTLARLGLALQNTVIEPGWEGYLTLELTYHAHGPHQPRTLELQAGQPIGQVLFHRLDQPSDQPYGPGGKYQNQESGPQEARFER